MSYTQKQDSATRDKAIQIFTYLRELAKYKTTPVRDISGWEVLWFHEIPNYKGFYSALSEQRTDTKEHIWLEISKPKEPRKPQLPSMCTDFVAIAADDSPLDEPQLKSNITEQSPEYKSIVDEYNQYIKQWRIWAEAYGPWGKANKVYEKLFYLNAQLKKLGEQYELVLGIGFLTWETPNNQSIKRHIITGDAELIFDPDKAKFQLQAASEGGTRLHFEVDMIEPTDKPSLEIEKNLEDKLKEVSENPWAINEISSILRSWVQSINPNGIYSDEIIPPNKCQKNPVVTLAPALILRKRTQQTQIKFFDQIVENIINGGKIPMGTSSICEIDENSDFDDYEQRVISDSGEGIYMPLEVNDEQIRIVHLSRTQNEILVQGPPGTGKSHTIANLICHLLALGKRILVTSQTPRALKVLKKFIPTELQSLCVNLLGNDQNSLQELNNAVEGINKAYANWKPTTHNRELNSLTEELSNLILEINNTKRNLRELREKDTYSHDIADGQYKGTSQQIAKRLVEESQELGWITDNIDENQESPLSNKEFQEFIFLYRAFSPEYCDELHQKIPDTSEIPDTEKFIELIFEEQKLNRELERPVSFKDSSRYRVLLTTENIKRQQLRESLSALTQYMSGIRDRFKWVQSAIYDILNDNDRPWKNLYSHLVNSINYWEKECIAVQDIKPQIPDHYDLLRIRADASQLSQHLAGGGKMGWKFFTPSIVKKTRYVAEDITINGYPCNTVDNLGKLIKYINVTENLDQAWEAFQAIDDREPGSIILQFGYLKERLEALENIIEIEKYLDRAKSDIKAIPGLTEPIWHDKDAVQAIQDEIVTADIENAAQALQTEIDETVRKVKVSHSHVNSHRLNKDILISIENRDPKMLTECLNRIQKLNDDRRLLQRRKELEAKLREHAPLLAVLPRIKFLENIWDSRSLFFESAWAWKRVDAWIARLNKESDPDRLEIKLKELEGKRKSTISKLAAKKAWMHCLSNLTEVQRKNLIAWAQEITKGGKFTGKYAPKYRRLAQQYMENCKGAIPAWVMPLHRVFETIVPQPAIYDVVIIDEASQTGPEGLMMLYLGKQSIIVGDSQQISPAEVGTLEAGIDSLIAKHLNGIPFQDQYGPNRSLFDHAAKFRSRIPLREHFRCMPEIIQFSNQLCYTSSPLIPLRQFGNDRLKPVLTFYMPDGIREGDRARVKNIPEATALVNKVLEFCKLETYVDKTIGIISLQGEEQALFIQQKLHESMTDAEWERRKIICGDAYAFQGDERDIIFLSMVAAPNERIGALVRENDKQRFNVAASRAKDQMILFHSVKLEDLNPECMRYKLLKYCLNPAIVILDSNIDKCESEFEKSVYRKISEKGYHVIPQFEIAGCFIDLMVIGEKNRLAVECDGDRWHGLDKWEQDNLRQRQLERSGCRFFRIRGSDYYWHPDVALEKLWTTLSDMGISPIGMSASNTADSQNEYATKLYTVNEPKETLIAKPVQNIINGTDIENKPLPKEQESPASKGVPVASNSRKKSITIVAPINSPELYLQLAHWAKETNNLNPWERHFIYEIGTIVRGRGQLSNKQKTLCMRIIEEAYKLGFEYAIDGK